MHFSIFLLLMHHSIPVTFPSLIHSVSMSCNISCICSCSLCFLSRLLSHSITSMLSTSITCLTLIAPNRAFQGEVHSSFQPIFQKVFLKGAPHPQCPQSNLDISHRPASLCTLLHLPFSVELAFFSWKSQKLP